MFVSSFIVLDDGIKMKAGNKQYTVNGTQLFPLDVPLPIIQKGKGCVGIGSISKIELTSSNTTIFFNVSSVNADSAKAYYALYRNQVSADAGDPYDSQDAFIPGAMGVNMRNSEKNRNSRRSGSLFDYMDY